MPEVPALLSVIGIGPQKTASTWLAELLGSGSALCFPAMVKETFFWDQNFSKGLRWYFGHFKGQGPRAEIGPTYFHAKAAPARLHAHNPDLRIIATLRDPAMRAWSLFLHHRRKGRVRTGFREAISAYPEILEASHYKRHLERWIGQFGRARVLVLLQEDIKAQPDECVRRLAGFLGMDVGTFTMPLQKQVNRAGEAPSPWLARVATLLSDGLRRHGLYRVVNAGKALGLKKLVYGRSGGAGLALGATDRAWLIKEFEDDIAYIEAFLDRPLPAWRA